MNTKIFIKLDGEKVMLIHNMPFDLVYGFNMTESELLSIGALVDSIPEAPQVEGKIALPMYNSTKGFWYELSDKPLDEVDRIKQEAIDTYTLELIEGGLI